MSIKARDERLATSKMFYQYQPIFPNDDRLEKLQRDKLWFSDPSKFNDPFDLKIPLDDLTLSGPFGDRSILAQAFGHLFKSNKTEVENHWFYDRELISYLERWSSGIEGYDLFGVIRNVERRFRSFGIACFTQAYDNPLMWSHYANNHKGFCIEYGVRAMNVLDEPEFGQFYVQYASELSKICVSEALFAPHQVMNRMIGTKSADWAYEKEWRLVHFEKKAELADLPTGIEISALIAGFKMEPKDIEKLRIKADLFEIPAYRMKQKGQSNVLMLEKI